MTNKKVTVIYGLTEAGRKESLLKGGDGKEIQIFEVDVTERLLELSNVDKYGELVLCVAIPNPRIQKGWSNELSTLNLNPNVQNCYTDKKDQYGNLIEYKITIFDKPQTIESILDAYEKAENKKQELEAELLKTHEDEIPALEEKKKKEQEEKEKQEKEKKEKEEKQKEEKEKREKEKVEWIKQYGSQYLKDCLELKQYAHKEYVYERAALEFPEFELDYNNEAIWKEKYSPSQESLNQLKELKNKTEDSDIVYLIKNVNGDCVNDYDDEYEGCCDNENAGVEALVIRKFLGKYDLIKIIDN